MNTPPSEQPERKLRRTHISAHDFERAGEFIDAAQKHSAATIEHEALLIAAVIHYARPFSGNEAPGAKDPPSDRSITVDARALLGADVDLHERLLVIRNKAVAHAEWGFYPTDRVDVGVVGRGIVMQSTRWHVVNERIDLDAFARIALAMRRWCQDRVVDFGER